MSFLPSLETLLSGAVSPGCQMGMGMGWRQRWENACDFPMFSIYGAALCLVLIVVVIFLLGRCTSKREGGKPMDTPLEILKRRYAKGEITSEQYEAFKRDMEL
jgi:putative membrane protein